MLGAERGISGGGSAGTLAGIVAQRRPAEKHLEDAEEALSSAHGTKALTF